MDGLVLIVVVVAGRGTILVGAVPIVDQMNASAWASAPVTIRPMTERVSQQPGNIKIDLLGCPAQIIVRIPAGRDRVL